MKKDLIIAGVGGQGILTIAALIGHTALKNALNIKQSEVHGMAQRGGAVVAHLRLSDKLIYSDLVPTAGADAILAVEPLEALRYLSYLKEDGIVLANQVPLKNIPDYPEEEHIYQEIRALDSYLLLDADKVAREAGSGRAMNMVMLGAVSPVLELPAETFLESITEFFASKGENTVAINKRAFAAGRDAYKL